jgi:hypothetical protein
MNWAQLIKLYSTRIIFLPIKSNNMKKLLLIITLLFFAIGITFAQKEKDKKKEKIPIENTNNFDATRFCPDPAITNINFKVMSRTAPGTGQVRIQVYLKNLGGRDFASEPGQARVDLYEHYPGASPTLIKTKEFTTLTAGSLTKIIRLRKNWVAGDFPPTYRAEIVYTPDIRMDGNKQNDDCDLKNNEKKRDGKWFNDQLL